MYKRACDLATLVTPMEQDYYLITGKENYILTPTKDKICADELINLYSSPKYCKDNTTQSPPYLVQREKYIYLINVTYVAKFKIEKRLVMVEKIMHGDIIFYRTGLLRFWMSSQGVLDLDSLKIHKFLLDGITVRAPVEICSSQSYHCCSGELKYWDGYYCLTCVHTKFMKLTNKCLYTSTTQPVKTILFDFDTCTQQILRGAVKIILHHSIKEVILISDDDYQIIRKGFSVGKDLPPPELIESLCGNKIILEYKKNPFETFTGEFEYKQHEYVRNLEMLHDVLNDAINNEPDFSLFVSEEKNKVTITIKINIKYVYETLIFELFRVEKNELEILNNKVNLLMSSAGFD
jgi:hypothetical protein